MKNHQNHFLGIQNIIGSPNFSHQNHWISIIWGGQEPQKLHLQDHPIRLQQWQLRTLCLKELPELGVWPRSAPHRVIRVFIIINIFSANDLVICGHTLKKHSPMSWANIPLVVWVPYSYVITTNHRKYVIFRQVLQGYKALGNSRRFLSHDLWLQLFCLKDVIGWLATALQDI